MFFWARLVLTFGDLVKRAVGESLGFGKGCSTSAGSSSVDEVGRTIVSARVLSKVSNAEKAALRELLTTSLASASLTRLPIDEPHELLVHAETPKLLSVLFLLSCLFNCSAATTGDFGFCSTSVKRANVSSLSRAGEANGVLSHSAEADTGVVTLELVAEDEVVDREGAMCEADKSDFSVRFSSPEMLVPAVEVLLILRLE